MITLLINKEFEIDAELAYDSPLPIKIEMTRVKVQEITSQDIEITKLIAFLKFSSSEFASINIVNQSENLLSWG